MVVVLFQYSHRISVKRLWKYAYFSSISDTKPCSVLFPESSSIFISYSIFNDRSYLSIFSFTCFGNSSYLDNFSIKSSDLWLRRQLLSVLGEVLVMEDETGLGFF